MSIASGVSAGSICFVYAKYLLKRSMSIAGLAACSVLRCISNIWLAIRLSFFLSGLSQTMNISSKLVSIGFGRFTFSVMFLYGSYLPYMGFDADKIDVLAFSVATMPPFATEQVCCSITS